MIYEFGEYSLDTENFELREGATKVPVEPLVFDLLSLLVSKPGALLTKDDLIDAVWDGRIVSESTVSTAIKTARKAVGDDGASQRFIRTVRGRGIQFVGEVESSAPKSAAPATPGDPSIEPRIAIVSDVSAAALEAFAHLIVNRIRTVLTRVPLLSVAASGFDVKAAADPVAARLEHGISLFLKLTVTGLGEQVIVDAALIETRNRFQLSGHDATIDEPDSAAVDKLVADVVGNVEPRILAAIIQDLDKASQSGRSREMLLRAMGMLSLKGYRRDTFLEASELLEAAIKVEPGLALAHAYLSLLNGFGHRVGVLRRDHGVVERAIGAAERALELDSQDSMVLGLAGCALADVGQVDRALPILRRAMEINPHNGHAKTAFGAALVMKRDFPEAEQYLSEGIRISPADGRRAVWGALHAMCLSVLDRNDEALQVAMDSCGADDGNYMPRMALAAVHLRRGEHELATVAVKDGLRAYPEIREDEVHYLVGETVAKDIWAIRTELAGPDA